MKPSIETVNFCSTKQVARWFCWRNVDKAYLAFIRLVKDEGRKIVLIILEKTEMGCEV